MVRISRRRPSRGAEAAGDDGTESCSITGVAQEWDSSPPIRARLRDGGGILHAETPPKQEDIKICTLNQELLEPLLTKMSQLAKRSLPTMDDLREECYALLILNKRTGEELVEMVEESAYAIKKLCSFVKAKARRKEVSTAN